MSLDHAEHDGADEGHGEVRGDNAQSPGERHEVPPSMRTAYARDLMVNRKCLSEKVSLAVAQAGRGFGARRPAWLKNHEINVLKSL
ncbi:hypothetical protein [Bradyrhizobium sp. 195]|uniref:hypothetical protein n=1 Tax=Bradyrhizobium sp. 195 TaxID=2782662 RepID=UPI002001576C|nr:hypothetical protein [Bradyrhizobium sp. 195]UPK28831.1 hypothetical protein IVB26_10615 [Bradyrhizobium sp. 195]